MQLTTELINMMVSQGNYCINLIYSITYMCNYVIWMHNSFRVIKTLKIILLQNYQLNSILNILLLYQTVI